MFGIRGFQGARTVEIAKIAGIPQPLIYFHFSNKVDLWNACADFSISTTLEREKAATGKIRSLEPKEALDFLLTNLIRRAHDDPDMARFYMRFGIERELNPELELRPTYQEGVELFRSNVAYLQEKGALPPEIEPTLMSYLLIGSATQIYRNQPDFERLTGTSLQDEEVIKAHVKAMTIVFSRLDNNKS